jgi:PPK2 family polyphosphate:nucleotide phosphotransferase
VKKTIDTSPFRAPHGKPLDLDEWPTRVERCYESKRDYEKILARHLDLLQERQRLLYAHDRYSLLLIFQAMDAAGKDGTIRHVMGAVNPQGCRVYSFKAPNDTELAHHFLWRPVGCLPKRGMISIFNRSYYEEVLVVRVHPHFLIPQRLPQVDVEKPKSLERLWKRRYREINAFERTITLNGTQVLKFYLHVSKDEQKERFLKRLMDPDKYWKFNERDLAERALWRDYRSAFEDALSATSTKHAPWYVIPADDKWYMRAAIADIIAAKLESLGLEYPEVDEAESARFAELADKLRNE